MIACLEGEILDLDFHSVIILTKDGVGYEVNINEYLYARLSLEENARIFIYHAISEGRESLYGFFSLPERKLFLELIKISGVGGRVALNLLNFGDEALLRAIRLQEKTFFDNVKGVGKKLGEKIFIEMGDKDIVKTVSLENEEIFPHYQDNKGEKDIFMEIKRSLVAMGYRDMDVEKELKNLPLEFTELATILPYIIKQLS